jgi:sugar/nucleoside kinase (ribokinase family)
MDVVDPTGSGDVFGAVFFLARLRGKSPERAMRTAARWAGFNCARSGTVGLNVWLRDREERYRATLEEKSLQEEVDL